MKTDEDTRHLPSYLLDNAEAPSAKRLPALSRTYDPGTMRHIEQLGIRPGWSCLEVGGGNGSIAAWLAERVGPDGNVLVTDIDPRHLAALSRTNVRVQRHDIASDPLPERAFDLVHARLVLLHIPERERVLARLIAALKPGGWLIDEELDYSVLPDPKKAPGEVLLPTHRAMLQLMDRRGVDRDWGRKLFGRFRAHGLEHVGAEGRAFMWPAGSAALEFLRGSYDQLSSELIRSQDVTKSQWESDVSVLESPDFVMPSPVLWATWGQRPLNLA